jgi:hypothetical protein
MTQSTRKDTPTEPRQDRRAAAPASAAKEKKAYRKPELSKYDQLHGIGLGS